MSAHYGGKQESTEEMKKKVQKLNISVGDLFDSSKPWILVPNGSILGYFDWVPEHLRVGHWSPMGMAYLFMIVYVVCMSLAWWRVQPRETLDLNYDGVGTLLWCYNLLGFLWTIFVNLTVLRGPAGAKAWATFTMWAWSTLTIRYGLSVLAPIMSKGGIALDILEYTRFPTLIMASVTFGMWNFVVGPFIYFFGMKTPEMKASFLKVFTSFRLTQLHVFNIVLAIGNCVVASPSRSLGFGDFITGILIAVIYFLFYLLVLDRIGVHLYPVFSPRTNWLILPWSFMIASFIGGFYFWNGVLSKGEWRGMVVQLLR